MAMTTTEQNNMNQALQTAGDLCVNLRVADSGSGTNVYVLCRKVPVQVLTTTQLATLAAALSVTVASP